MIVFLYSLSDLSVTILFASVAAIAFIAAPLLRVRLLGHVSEATSETARTTMTMITGFTGAVLAFSLVQAQGNLRSVERVVAAEAMQLDQADRLLTSYGDANVAAIREAVRAYAQSIVSDEWPKLSEHDDSQRTADLFRSLSRQILAIQPTPGRGTVIYSDLVRIADQLAESRQERLEATASRIAAHLLGGDRHSDGAVGHLRRVRRAAAGHIAGRCGGGARASDQPGVHL